MNRIYKSVWNAVTRSWTAVSENQRSQRKGARGIKSIMTCTALFASLLSSTAVWAAHYWPGDVNCGPITIGDNSENNVKAEDHYFEYSNIVSRDYHIHFTSKESSLDAIGGAQGLLSLANNGYEQIILKGGNLTYVTGLYPSKYFIYDGEQTVTQGLTQGDQKVADLVFAVGDRAYSLFNNNRDIFGIADGFVEDADDPLRVPDDSDNGIRFSSNSDDKIVYNDTGIAIRRENDAPQEGIWLMTLLTDINLMGADSGLTLDFSRVSTEQSLTARLNGEGNITYVGQSGNVLNISALIERDENGDTYNNKSIYTGSTFVKGLTLNLNKNKSLGNTSLLSIGSGATVNVGTDSEDVGKLDLSDGILNLNDKTFNVGNAGAVISSDGQLKGSKANLVIDGDLTVKSENTAYQNSKVSASKITVSSASAFGRGTESTASEKYVFDGAEVEESLSVRRKVFAGADNFILAADLECAQHGFVRPYAEQIEDAACDMLAETAIGVR